LKLGIFIDDSTLRLTALNAVLENWARASVSIADGFVALVIFDGRRRCKFCDDPVTRFDYLMMTPSGYGYTALAATGHASNL
jgi:hypothetical protein